MSRDIVRVFGQDSLTLKTRSVELAIALSGGMLGPIKFFPEDPTPISPYAVAPWADETVPPDLPPMLRSLRGDWFCSAFGGNAMAHRGRKLPPHGESANNAWYRLDSDSSAAGCWLKLGVDLPLQGGHCRKTVALLADQSIVYQRHDLRGLQGPINPGHHATLAFPDRAGAGTLSFSPFSYAHTFVEATEFPENRGYSWLRPDTQITDLSAVPCIDGTNTDLCRYPARRGFEDIAIVCADQKLALAWSAVTFPHEGFAWFALRDPRLLASTLLWFSNGGRHFPPWSGRHVNVLGIEDITAYFHVGIAASCEPNALSARGILTCLEPDRAGRLSIPYIQGVARIHSGFDRVAAIEPGHRNNAIVLRSESGIAVEIDCEIEFLRTGRLQGLSFT